MKKVISDEKHPIKMWLDDIEEGALAQARNLANLPFTFKHIALMPDAHQGYGMPIGGVLATQGVVIPNAVGVDIGCGVRALRTGLSNIDTDILKNIVDEIKKMIPVGFSHQQKKQDEALMPEYPDGTVPVIGVEYDSALFQIGTLGGGNHFIEIQKGSDGNIWIMLHSGSRNLGYKVANHYNKVAIELNTKWHSEVPKEWQLAFLPLDEEQGRLYMKEMQYCVDFAKANRALMMSKIQDAFLKFIPNIVFESEFDVPHNYAAYENHFGKNVMAHRKGATRAYSGEIGLIPGSQGTASYIVRGLGNPESFKSCSHGAGRRMGRKQAQRELDLLAEIKAMDDKGIIHSIKSVKDLDEAPGSYKDIDVVMRNQADLVESVIELKPLAVVKG